MSGQDKEFFLEEYLPKLEVQTHNVSLTTLEKAELLENTAGTLIKIFFAFFWQESIIDLGGELILIRTLRTGEIKYYPRTQRVARDECLRSLPAAPPQYVC